VVAGAAAGDEERPRPRGGFRWKAEHSCGEESGVGFRNRDVDRGLPVKNNITVTDVWALEAVVASHPPIGVEVELGQTGPGRAHHFIPFLFFSFHFYFIFFSATSCNWKCLFMLQVVVHFQFSIFFIQPFLFISIHVYIDYVCKLCAEIL
jgi:hypothetical protein